MSLKRLRVLTSTDDFWCVGPACAKVGRAEGPTEMDAYSSVDMGLSESDMVAVTKGWYGNIDSVQVPTPSNFSTITPVLVSSCGGIMLY